MFESFSFEFPIVKLVIAVLLGAFMGLRREMDAQSSDKHRSFMGLRTMMLLCLLGALSTIFEHLPYLPVVFFGAVLALVSIAYVHGSFELNRIGMTTELSAITAFWIGVLVGYEHQVLAILLTLFLASINAFKETLHRFVKTLNPKEWFGAFQLLALSGAVLPFLPREPIDPWGVFVPFSVWLLVMLISGIGFVGYFLIKYLGVKGGVPLTGFLGSIVSSTAVTISMATQSKMTKLNDVFAGGILIALGTMQVRVAAEILLLGTPDFYKFLIVPIAMAVVSILGAIYFFYRSNKKHHWWSLEPDTIKLESPFEFGPALKFGLVFVVVLFALALGQKYLGNSGVYAAAFLSGLIDIDAIVLSSLESVKLGELNPVIAQNSIAIAIMVNTTIKVAYVAVIGAYSLVGRVAVGVGVVTAIGAGALFLL